MASPTARSLRGLILSASELRQEHPSWTDAMIEDYLNIYSNLFDVATEVDTKGDWLKKTEIVVASTFTITDEDELFCNPTASDIVLNLPAGEDGRKIRIHNVGSSDNQVVITPNGTDLLFGINSSEDLYDSEVVIITYNETYGWD